MSIKYAHTNIISKDWRKLVAFYQEVFNCEPVPPQRSQSGAWLEQGTGVSAAALEGMHLRLPGHGPDGPTLEIYQYTALLDKPDPHANRLGFGHIAFLVDDVKATLDQIITKGGSAIGKLSETEVPGKGHLTFVYATDPEGNIIEIQKWS